MLKSGAVNFGIKRDDMKIFTVAELTKLAQHYRNDDPGTASPAPWMTDLLLFVKQWTGPDDFIDVKTSGSTGLPKLIRHPKTSMLASARMTCNFLDLKPGMNALLCLSTRNIAGMMMVVRCFERDMNIVAVPPDGHPLKHALPDVPLHFAAMVPAQVYNSLKDTIRDEGKRSIDSVENLIIGGAPVGYGLLKELEQVPGKVYATFGMTETISHVALRRLNRPSASETPDCIASVKDGRDYRPLVTHTTDFSEISDEYTALGGIGISVGPQGNLILEVPYLPEPHVVTNDLVEITGKHTFRWLGRMDHVINTGGFKVFPESIETRIAQVMDDHFRSHLSTQRYFIAGVPDEKLGERIVLVVEDFEERPAHKVKPQAPVLKAFNEVLAHHEVPQEIWYTSRFIETPTGKIIRSATVKKF